MSDEQSPVATVRYPLVLTEIGGVPIPEIVALAGGTPAYAYDAARITQRVRDLAAFDVIRYAQKASNNIAIVDLIRRLGVLADATSAGELHRAFAAGFEATGEPDPVVYTADIFDRESLALVHAKGVHVNCGSIDMIEQYAEGAPRDDITLRLNPGFGHGHSQKTNTGGDQSKHGIWHEELGAALQAARSRGLRVTGIHVHIGSGTDMSHLAEVCGAVEALALEAGPEVTTISGGGGLPTPYTNDDPEIDIAAHHELWDATRKRLETAFGHPLTLEIEPGRYLLAESGYLITEIRAIKRQGGNTFYVVDAGFNNLARPVLYGAYHPMAIVPASGTGEDRPLREVVVGGPLCESGDIFTQKDGGFVRREPLPEAEVGELLVIGCAGAYAASMGSNYNAKPMAPEVLVADQTPHLIRRRQSLDDLIANETLAPLG